MEVPQSVVDLIVDLRAHREQDKWRRPPSRPTARMVKSVELLRVAAYTNGRAPSRVRLPAARQRLMAEALGGADRARVDPRAPRAGPRGGPGAVPARRTLFGRACRADGDKSECEALRQEAASLRAVLSSQIAQLAGTTTGSLPALREHLWLSPPEAERAAQTLGPLFGKVRRGLEKLRRGDDARGGARARHGAARHGAAAARLLGGLHPERPHRGRQAARGWGEAVSERGAVYVYFEGDECGGFFFTTRDEYSDTQIRSLRA